MVFNFVLILTFVVFGCVKGQTVNYCVNDTATEKHTMCQYPPGISPDCKRTKQGESIALTQQERDGIVEVHNEARATVAVTFEKRGNPGPQPIASNMNEISYDPELATIAQRWADQCLTYHDRFRKTDRYSVGQNIMVWRNGNNDTRPDFVGAVKIWWDEVQDFNPIYVKEIKPELRDAKKMTGHYTQLVWAETHLVGCGVAHWKEGGQHVWILVCDYSPEGNIMGLEIYQSGGTCSRCTEPRNKCVATKKLKFPALCGKK